MIEVEKKFILTDEQEKALIDSAEFLGEKIFTDIYYDDSDYSLTKKDIWLRNRAGRFGLKTPMNKSIEIRILDRYNELENDEDILKYFGVATDSNLIDVINNKGYKPFCKFTTTRRKYKKEGFNIDLDTADFGYSMAEIEFMTNDDLTLREVTDSIIKFAEKHNIESSSNHVRGKVLKYLEINNPQHLQALIDAKVIK
jgi:adenylate cyclase class IV